MAAITQCCVGQFAQKTSVPTKEHILLLSQANHLAARVWVVELRCGIVTGVAGWENLAGHLGTSEMPFSKAVNAIHSKESAKRCKMQSTC